MTRRWTLRRKLVVGISALVAAGFLITSLTTIVALRSFVFERLDVQVTEALDLAIGLDGQRWDLPGDPDGPDLPDDADGPAPRVGSLQAVLDEDGSAISSSYTRADGTEITLDGQQIAALSDALDKGNAPQSVDLGSELGAFRIAASSLDGETIVAGIPLDDATATTTALTVILFSVAGCTLLVAVVGLSMLVRRNLRPLDRVAAVAQRVSARRLAEGAVAIPERVDPSDTDPHTEVGRVGTSLNDLLGHIEAALTARQHSEEQLRRFIADASHELRTPLASIRGYAQLSLSEDAAMTPTQERSFDRIQSEAERMGSLVDDLLLLARLDAGQTLRKEDVELTLVAVDAVSDAHAADSTHEWRLDVSEELISVPGDGNRIRQVLANLLRNALTHTPAGTVVTTSLTQNDADAILTVEDDGPGIAADVRDRLFDRFARGDHARNRDAGSTGLGLSIAHAIIIAHGGSIAVDSIPGRTVFTVRLPLHAPQLLSDQTDDVS
ncbi:HAMP domain-containing sensor histidine kinase [Microbacterium sp.]|uniref:sensor histidine kinase n=1 Tax=Microbacterium sp. TaxID=51671 RepID=UPI002898E853|nr:HAMP domain-containing sensor histidine kinase [Microbacterium sp.]